ncbi:MULTISPECIES: anthranilate synthase component II [Streptomyces]|uniref:Aminodeoxychorismate/anthranilate synthase component II n=1 Tax=Streptomyces chilikensis TaxID=1194079 RepID=A0ABV3EW47_9ACTN|nr:MULTISPECIES: aminodeoxychorismate/anthranilate synthase component II [Streptomyces]MDH6226758.1 anthranilate synthase/aminodeoxychorismate synthase-like glutamine amidotransferase [Streptomyces sp. MJP52]
MTALATATAPRAARTGAAPRVVVVDNYDSFTYNLVQYLAEAGADPVVRRNDAVTVEELATHDAVLISPGPGAPGQAGVSLAAVRELSGRVPLLGVCLGHQTIGEAFGAAVVRVGPVHGKTDRVRHDGTGVLAGLPDPFTATRYHSLAVDPDTLPAELVANAWAQDGTVMGLRHREHPTFGVQFHPESVLTEQGRDIVVNFLQEAAR